jgi:AcrR family transcriptional regulator
MARRADHTREELTELAIIAGLELIKAEGFSSFSARKLATRIGYTVGTLYNVFGSYDDMMLHINARTLDEWFAHMQAALQNTRGRPPLHALARAYIEYSKTHSRQWTVLFEYSLSQERELPAWYGEKLTRFFLLVENELYPLVNRDRRKARRAAHVLWAGIHGICTLSLSGKMELVKAEAAETLAFSFMDNYMAGLTGKR